MPLLSDNEGKDNDLSNNLKKIAEFLTEYMVFYTIHQPKIEGIVDENYEYHFFNGDVLQFPDNYWRLYSGVSKLRDLILENMKKDKSVNPKFIRWFEKHNYNVKKFLLIPMFIVPGVIRCIRSYDYGVKTNIEMFEKLPGIDIPYPPSLYIV